MSAKFLLAKVTLCFPPRSENKYERKFANRIHFYFRISRENTKKKKENKFPNS